MASNAAPTQQKNLESSVLFMQQEHAATLKALHDEIHKLQSRCTDLTFQLTMSGVNVEEGGDADTRLQDLTRQLQASRSQESSLQAQVQEQNQHAHQLSQELRGIKKRHLDETRNAERAISGLKAEVEAKANNIAYLTSELHRLRVKAPALDPHEVKVRHQQHQYLPAPPRDLLTNSARLRQGRSGSSRHRSSSSSGLRHIGAVSTGARVTSASDQPPDISPFVAPRDLEVSVSSVEVRKPAPPLPPISKSGARGGERELHRVVIAKGGKLTRASVPEVATLAVDQIHGSGGSAAAEWMKRSSESHSCGEQR